ncbi:MAG: hypothetical protein HY554_11360 [Elusimicrobia bacterium]|nr:hypothetical protein [Elusimicrobiota bacterium]
MKLIATILFLAVPAAPVSALEVLTPVLRLDVPLVPVAGGGFRRLELPTAVQPQSGTGIMPLPFVPERLQHPVVDASPLQLVQQATLAASAQAQSARPAAAKFSSLETVLAELEVLLRNDAGESAEQAAASSGKALDGRSKAKPARAAPGSRGRRRVEPATWELEREVGRRR